MTPGGTACIPGTPLHPMSSRCWQGACIQTRCRPHPVSPDRVDVCLDGHARAGKAWTGHLQSVAEPLWICRHGACLHWHIHLTPAEGWSCSRVSSIVHISSVTLCQEWARQHLACVLCRMVTLDPRTHRVPPAGVEWLAAPVAAPAAARQGPEDLHDAPIWHACQRCSMPFCCNRLACGLPCGAQLCKRLTAGWPSRHR